MAGSRVRGGAVAEEFPSVVELRELQLAMGADAWRAVSDAAQVVANYLACHPRVMRVRYPGLTSDPAYPLASRTLERGFGPYLAYQTKDTCWHALDLSDAPDAKETVLVLERRLLQ